MEELSYVLTQYCVSSVHVRFYFSMPLIFTLLAASISHFLTAALNFLVFLHTEEISLAIRGSCAANRELLHTIGRYVDELATLRM